MKAMAFLILSAIPGGSYYHPHFTEGETEAGKWRTVIQTDDGILEMSCSATPFVASTGD